LADQRPVIEFAGFLDLFEGHWRVDSAAKAKIGDGETRIAWVVAARSCNVGYSYNCRIPHAMVKEHTITGLHFADDAQGLGVPNAIPNRLAIAL